MPSSGVQTCALDRKSTRLNSSHLVISYAVFCLKKYKEDTSRFPAPGAVLLTDVFSLPRFSPHPPIVARTITLNDKAATIIGFFFFFFDWAPPGTPPSPPHRLSPY